MIYCVYVYLYIYICVYVYYIERHRKLDCIMPWFPGDLYPELQQIVAQNKCRM